MKDKNITEGARGVRCNGWVMDRNDDSMNCVDYKPCGSVKTEVYFDRDMGMWFTRCHKCGNEWSSRYQSKINGVLLRSPNR